MAEAKLHDVGLGELVSQDSKFFFLPSDVDAKKPKVSASIFEAVSTPKAQNSQAEASCPILTSSFVIDAVTSLSQEARQNSLDCSAASSTTCKSEPTESPLEPWNLAASSQPLGQKEPKIVLLPSISNCSGSIVTGTFPTAPEPPSASLQDLPKRCRTNLTDEQKLELEKTFAKSKYPDYPLVDELSRRINLPYKKVLVWFKNRRAKDKRARKTDFGHCDFVHHPPLGPYAGATFNGPCYAAAQYSLRPCLPTPYHAAAGGYWLDRDIAGGQATASTSGSVKCDATGNLYPFGTPPAHYIFVTGENMATQTSPTLELDDDQQELEKVIAHQAGQHPDSPDSAAGGPYLPVVHDHQQQAGFGQSDFYPDGCSPSQFADFAPAASLMDSRLA